MRNRGARWLLVLLAIVPVCAAVRSAPRTRKARAVHASPVERGFDHFYNAEYPEAATLFKQAVEAAPNDPELYNHLAEAVLFGMLNRTGGLEGQMVTGADSFLRNPSMEPGPEEQAEFAFAIQKVLDLTGERLQQNPDDAGALYARGLAIAFRGTFRYMVKKSWIDSLRDATEARRLHNRVQELDPGRVDARMLQGVCDYAVGALPTMYKMLGALAGFHGDRDAGIRTLQLVAAQGVTNRVQAELLLCVIYRRERRPFEAIPLLESLHRRFPRNFLVLMELSQMYADLGDRARTMAPLDKIEKLKRSGAPGLALLPEERIQLARGAFLFWHKEFDPAIRDLEQATAHASVLDPNSGATAWLRLGQCYDLKGRRKAAVHAYEHAAAFAPASESAQEAEKYVDAPFTREKMREIQHATRLREPRPGASASNADQKKN